MACGRRSTRAPCVARGSRSSCVTGGTDALRGGTASATSCPCIAAQGACAPSPTVHGEPLTAPTVPCAPTYVRTSPTGQTDLSSLSWETPSLPSSCIHAGRAESCRACVIPFARPFPNRGCCPAPPEGCERRSSDAVERERASEDARPEGRVGILVMEFEASEAAAQAATGAAQTPLAAASLATNSTSFSSIQTSRGFLRTWLATCRRKLRQLGSKCTMIHWRSAALPPMIGP